MGALGRLVDAHAREAFRSIVGVIAIGGGPLSLVPGCTRVVGCVVVDDVGVGRGIRVIIVSILVSRRIIGVVRLLVKSLTRVWVVVGHSRRCRRIPRKIIGSKVGFPASRPLSWHSLLA